MKKKKADTGNSAGIPHLKVRGKGAILDCNLSIGAGKALNFYLSPDIMNGDTLLVVDAPFANISGSTVCLGMDDGTLALRIGDTITLIDNTGKLFSDHHGIRAQGIPGCNTPYDFILSVEGDRLMATAVGVGEAP